MINKEIVNYPILHYEEKQSVGKILSEEILTKFLPKTTMMLKKYFWEEPKGRKQTEYI